MVRIINAANRFTRLAIDGGNFGARAVDRLEQHREGVIAHGDVGLDEAFLVRTL